MFQPIPRFEPDAGELGAAPHAGGMLAKVANLVSRGRTSLLLLVMWLLILPVSGVLGSMLYGIANNDASSYLPRSAESTQVYSILAHQGRPQPATATVVYVRETGITQQDRARVAADASRFAGLTGGLPVSRPIPSADGRALIVNVPVPGNVAHGVSAMRAQIASNRPAGLQASVTGPAGQAADIIGVFADGLDGKILGATIVVVTVVLLLTYRSPVLWLLPLLTVGVSYNVATAAIYLLAGRTGMVISSETTGILPVLVFGAGTDYALLLIARYREELQRHADRRAAMAVAWRRAVPAMAASAATVSISLLCLSVAEMNSTRGLGAAGAIGIAAALIGMTTLLPAVLTLTGRWIFWPSSPRPGTQPADGAGLWGRIGRRIGRRPRPVWIGAVVALVLLSAGLGQSRFGLSQTQVFRTTPDSAVGLALVARHYPAGASDPTLVVVPDREAAGVSMAARGIAGVAQVLPASQIGGRSLIPVVLTDAPLTPGAEATVQRLRNAFHPFPGTMVGGDTAMDLDTRSSSVRDAKVVMPLVLAVILVILALVLRALVAPLILVATVALSYLASLGAGSLLFQHVFGFAAFDYSVPLMGFVFMVALGVDYNIFLMTRARQEVAERGHRRGVLAGLRATGGVITGAGIVLAATFAVLSVMPLVFMVELGTLVALGVLIDTLIVRSIVVPALALDLGPVVWWPSLPGQPGRGRGKPRPYETAA
jgi:RND superfamily putative drug exporter